MLINLDKHEMFWLLESAARGSHLRQGLWNKFIDTVFPFLEPSEIRFLHDQCKEKLSELYPNENAVGYEDFQRFLARFDIDNNYYLVLAVNPDTKKEMTLYAYKLRDKYFVKSTRFISPDCIKRVMQVPYTLFDDKFIEKLSNKLGFIVMAEHNNVHVFIDDNSPSLIAWLEDIGYRRSLIDDFKGEITVITEGVITTADRDFPKRNPEYVEFYPDNELN